MKFAVLILFVWVSVAAGADDGASLELLTLESFINDAMSTADVAKQKEALGKLLQRPVPPGLASSARVWQLRGAAALQLDREVEGKEAGRKLRSLGVTSAGNSDALAVLVALNSKGWVETESDYTSREQAITKFDTELAAYVQTMTQQRLVNFDALKVLQENLRKLVETYNDQRLVGFQDRMAEAWLQSLKLKLDSVASMPIDSETNVTVKADVATFKALVNYARDRPKAKQGDLDVLRKRVEAVRAYYPTPTGMKRTLQRFVPDFGRQYMDSTEWKRQNTQDENFPSILRQSAMSFYNIDLEKYEVESHAVRAMIWPGTKTIKIEFWVNNIYEAESMFKKVRKGIEVFVNEQRELTIPRKFLPVENTPTHYTVDAHNENNNAQRVRIDLKQENNGAIMLIIADW